MKTAPKAVGRHRAKRPQIPRRHPARATSIRPPDAVAMLRADHGRVAALFEHFENARGVGRKKKLALQICDELEVHVRLEEEIFYPAVRGPIANEAMMDEATVEHQTAIDLIKQIRGMSPGDSLYDARVKVLGEYIRHHVKEEHTEMFPQARNSGVDLRELGEQMRSHKESITGSALGILRRLLR